MSLLSRRSDSRGSASVVDPLTVREAVSAVHHPELDLTLAEADLLGSVDVGRSGQVTLAVRVTTATGEVPADVVAEVRARVGALDGVRSVEVRPEAMTEPQRMALASLLRSGRPEGRRPFDQDSGTRVYAVASGKGGVGKSTVTANLAVALAQQGQRVGVLDADVWGYSVPQLFGVRERPVALKGMMLPVRAHGVALMSVGFLVEEEQPVVWRGPMLHKAIEQFISDVHWGELEVLVVDLPPGTGDVTLTLLELLPDAQLVAVTTPQLAAQQVATRVGRMARDVRMPVAGVIENMSAAVCESCSAQTALFGEGGGQRLATAIDAPLLGRVPLDLPLRVAGDQGVPAVVAAPDAPSVVELRRIALALPTVRRSLIGRSLPLSVV